MSYDLDHQPQGVSGGAKVAIGCAAAAFLGLVLACGGIVWLAYVVVDKAEQVVVDVIAEVEKQVDSFATRFEAQGYERVSGQQVTVTTDVERPTVYTVQVFRLDADAQADLAVMAQVAEINGNIDGDLHFFGQSLMIGPDAVITGHAYVHFAQTVDNKGTVEGKIIESETIGLEEEAPEDPGADQKPLPGEVVPRDQDGSEPGEPDTGATSEGATPPDAAPDAAAADDPGAGEPTDEASDPAAPEDDAPAGDDGAAAEAESR
jgi:hypothetical protein